MPQKLGEKLSDWALGHPITVITTLLLLSSAWVTMAWVQLGPLRVLAVIACIAFSSELFTLLFSWPDILRRRLMRRAATEFGIDGDMPFWRHSHTVKMPSISALEAAKAEIEADDIDEAILHILDDVEPGMAPEGAVLPAAYVSAELTRLFCILGPPPPGTPGDEAGGGPTWDSGSGVGVRPRGGNA